MDSITRRKFLRAAAAGGTAYAMAHTPGVSFAQMAGGGALPGYKALVCIFLFGGNDSWNALVPRLAAARNRLVGWRSIAVRCYH